MQREEPYLGLTCRTLPGLDMFRTASETGPPLGAGSQVVHGRRQLVS